MARALNDPCPFQNLEVSMIIIFIMTSFKQEVVARGNISLSMRAHEQD